MSSSRDPFGFSSRTPPGPQSQQGANPIILVAQPGQELRIVIADDGNVGGAVGGVQNRGDTSGAASPSAKGDTSGAASPSGKGDSSGAASPSGKGDTGTKDPFGFQRFQRGFSPSPITIVAHSGQEVRIVVPNKTASFQGLTADVSGSASPSPKGDG